jgi:predicted O-methyltransferase YrrM
VTWPVLLDAVRSANLTGVRLAVKSPHLAREYWAQGLRRYYELMGFGLPPNDPIAFVYNQGWAIPAADDCAQLPVTLQATGITRLDELLVLAMATRVLRPKKVFEIGTFMGHATSAFLFNAPPGCAVLSLDLPPDADVGPEVTTARYLDTDVELVRQRRVGSFLHGFNLQDRYEQIYCDSLDFDPAPHAGSVELGFIDGAHTREYVENDTRKMAAMMAEQGLVFWHDYGGRGRFRALTAYIESLAKTIAIYRVPNTTLAWAPAAEVRKIMRS